jgi:hypothetical protein
MPAFISGKPNTALSAATISDLETGADRVAAHRRNADLGGVAHHARDLLQVLGDILDDIQDRVNLAGEDLRILVHRYLEVVADAESLADAGDDDCLDIGVVRRLAQQLDEAAGFLGVDRVEDFRLVEAYPGDPVDYFVQQLGHRLVCRIRGGR